jgi:hypothetical protein
MMFEKYKGLSNDFNYYVLLQNTYDTEVSAYAQRLNRIFALCTKCERMLQSKLAADKQMLDEMYSSSAHTPRLNNNNVQRRKNNIATTDSVPTIAVTPPTLNIARSRHTTNWVCLLLCYVFIL